MTIYEDVGLLAKRIPKETGETWDGYYERLWNMAKERMKEKETKAYHPRTKRLQVAKDKYK